MHDCGSGRDKSKSPEHAVAGRCAAEVGLNPAQIRATLDILSDHLTAYYGDSRAPGAITHTAVSAREPAGKPIKNCQVVPVPLTVFHPADVAVLRDEGSVALRMTRIFRITNEARDAGGLLSYEDLSALLCLDPSTVGDLVRRLREQGFIVPTRGFVKDIGPAPSHKQLIANLLGRGFSTSQIVARTKHSEGAIGRYQQQFAIVLYLLHLYPDAADDDRCRLSGLSEAAYRAYREVADELAKQPEYLPHLERLRRRYELDPQGNAYANTAPAKAPRQRAAERLEQHNLTNAVRQAVQNTLGTTKRVAEIVAGDLMELVQDAYCLPEALRQGELIVLVDAYDPTLFSGERPADRQVIPVRIPLLTEDALAIWRNDESSGRRRARLACLIATATIEQGGIMTMDKLAEILHVQAGTLAKNLRDLAVQLNEEILTKGIMEDAGPTLTHKNWIVDLDNHGMTGEEISWLTRHAPVSRDRYIETYRRAETLMHLEDRLPTADELARLFSIRTHVAQQYVDLLRRYHPDRDPNPGSAPTGQSSPSGNEEGQS